MIRFAILAAVSSKPQAAEDKISIPDQIKLCRQDGLTRGWQETAGPFVIPGVTRTRWINLRDAENGIYNDKDDTYPLRDMLNAAQHHQFDVLILYHYNRLRELLDSVDRTLQVYGVQMTSHSQWTEPQPPNKYDPLSDIGKTVRFASSFTSNAEITEFRRRYRQGMPARILKGLHKGMIPYGYHKPLGHEYDRKAVVVPHPLYSLVVIRMKDLYLSGQSLWQIAEQLNTDNIPAPRGGSWTDIKIRSILLNTFYAGEVYFGLRRRIIDPRNGKITHIRNNPESVTKAKGLHTPLWDEATYQKIIQEFQKRGRKYSGKRLHRLSHLLYCGFCGASCWTRYMNGVAKDENRRFICSKDSDHVYISEQITLDRLTTELINVFSNLDNISLPQHPQPDETPEDNTNLLSRLDRIQEAYEAGAMTLPEYTKRKSEIDAIIKESERHNQEKRNAKQRQSERLEIIGGFQGILNKMPAYITQAPAQEVNNQLRSIIKRIVITPSTLEIELND